MAKIQQLKSPQGESIYPQTIPEAVVDAHSGKTFKQMIDEKQDVIADLSTIRSGASLGATALQAVPNTYRTSAEQDVIDNGKVDKITGKGLSTNDYTNAEKTKLESLENYDDTALKGRVSTIEGKESGWDAKLDDAPSDGNQYARQNGEWAQVQGGGGAEGAVRYDEAQSLTDAQKQQARQNIDAQEMLSDGMISALMFDGVNYKWKGADGRLHVSTTKPTAEDTYVLYSVPAMSGSKANYLSNYSHITKIYSNGWDTSAVTNMQKMFNGCSQLQSLDVSGWDTSAVTSMFYMFSGCSQLQSIIGNKTYEEVVADENIKALNGLKVDLSVSATILDHASLLALVRGLADLTTLEVPETQTLTLGATLKNKLTADERKIATDKGWVLA